MTLLQPMMVAALLVGGLGVALLGSIKVPLARRLQIDEARVGGLVSLFGFVMIPVILTAGFLTDLVGKQMVLMAGSILMGVSLVLLAQARTYTWALVGVLLLGGAWSLLINVANVLTPIVFTGSTAHATNLANVFFGLGAFLTPLTVALLLRRASLPVGLSVLGALTLMPALLAVGVNFSSLGGAGQNQTGDQTGSEVLGTLLSDPVLWLCGFALFFYGPLEASVAAWATTYLGDHGVPPARAASLLSGFWLAFMASRLVTAFTLPEGLEVELILCLGVIAVGVLLGFVVSRRENMAIALVLAAGLVFGPIFPTVMAVLLGHFPSAVHGRAVGLFFAVGGIGWTTVPLLIGAYASRQGVQKGFSVAVAAAMCLCVVALILVLRQG